jgi:hypothetical protein
MLQAEAARIEARGGRIDRVVLDFELKKKVYAERGKANNSEALEYVERQAQIAAANGLTVVDGKIPLPDLRIKYETANGEPARVDLELATDHYRRGHISEKAHAGFRMVWLHFHIPRIAGRMGRPRNHRRDSFDMTNILQKFGYTETEARFLELVIPLGGYFVRRQFNQFAACKTGKRTHDFVQKLLTGDPWPYGRMATSVCSGQGIFQQSRAAIPTCKCCRKGVGRQWRERARISDCSARRRAGRADRGQLHGRESDSTRILPGGSNTCSGRVGEKSSH